PGPSCVVDDHAAKESVLAGPAQSDAQVAAVRPAGRQEAHARTAGRAPELQFAVYAVEALDDPVAALRLGIAARVLVDDPAVAPDFIAAAGAAIRARAHGDRRVVFHRPQPRRGQRGGEQVVGARGPGA